MGVAASSMPPESELETRARNIPPEMMEEILLHLPVKSLLRFCTVSKAWHSMIFDARFVRRHRSCSRAEMMIATIPTSGIGASTRPLNSINPNQIIGGDGKPLICPFEGGYSGSLRPRHLASCGELWCAQYGYSLFLWNPSMRTFRKLPHPPGTRPHQTLLELEYCFGVGYDPVADDYKILKFKFREFTSGEHDEVYSLRSDSWKRTEEPFPGKIEWHRAGVAASGALHWLTRRPRAHSVGLERVIICFDLSSEKYTQVPMPPQPQESYYEAELSVLRGKLSVALNYSRRNALGVYMMQEYGVGKSWVKIFEYQFAPFTSYFLSHDESGLIGLRRIPSTDDNVPGTLICADEESMEQRVFRCYDSYTCHLYVETLISPETYCGRRQRTLSAGNQLTERDCLLPLFLLLWFCFFPAYLLHLFRIVFGKDQTR